MSEELEELLHLLMDAGINTTAELREYFEIWGLLLPEEHPK